MYYFERWLHELTGELSKSFSVSSILLAYTTAPGAQYPTQLSQAAELLDHLITNQGRKPSDIILAGDSAGANLALALISHILHPHPDVAAKIQLRVPLKAVVLISPWVDFDPNQSSFNRNVQTDMIDKAAGTRWSGAFMGAAKPDEYNQPVLADKQWFKNLGDVVEHLMIWGGGGEVLIDSIDRIAWKLKEALPSTEYVVEVSFTIWKRHERDLV